MRRVWMLPSPGRANSESAGEPSISGWGGSPIASGNGAGTSIPRPAATPAAEPLVDVHKHRDDALADRRHTCTIVSSKRSAAMMWACSTGVWLR